jgi:hypothetical protein
MVQKALRLNTCLFEDLAESSFWHIAIVIGHGGILSRAIIKPNFMATGSMDYTSLAIRL